MSSIVSGDPPTMAETFVSITSAACLFAIFVVCWATIGAQTRAPMYHDIFDGIGCFAKGMMMFAAIMTLFYQGLHVRMAGRNYASYRDAPLKPVAMITATVVARLCLLFWAIPLAIFAVALGTHLGAAQWPHDSGALRLYLAWSMAECSLSLLFLLVINILIKFAPRPWILPFFRFRDACYAVPVSRLGVHTDDTLTGSGSSAGTRRGSSEKRTASPTIASTASASSSTASTAPSSPQRGPPSARQPGQDQQQSEQPEQPEQTPPDSTSVLFDDCPACAVLDSFGPPPPVPPPHASRSPAMWGEQWAGQRQRPLDGGRRLLRGAWGGRRTRLSTIRDAEKTPAPEHQVDKAQMMQAGVAGPRPMPASRPGSGASDSASCYECRIPGAYVA